MDAKKKILVFLKRLVYYARIWWAMSKNSFLVYLNQKPILFIFLFGKLFRFGMFFAFLYFLVKGVNTLAGYKVEEVIFFFLTFNFVDIVSQFLFREVYRFKPLIINGDFDLILVKPHSALFRVLMGGADVIDLITIPPLIVAMVYYGGMLGPTIFAVIIYTLLLLNALIIATAFHILVLSFGIMTMEVDYTVMLYRDVLNLGRFPINIYRQPLRLVLTYLIPVGLMITLPVNYLLGFVEPSTVILTFLLGIIFLLSSLKFWKKALKSYSSASS